VSWNWGVSATPILEPDKVCFSFVNEPFSSDSMFRKVQRYVSVMLKAILRDKKKEDGAV
jgi:hypothetical protein